jgi:hypothetical protein
LTWAIVESERAIIWNDIFDPRGFSALSRTADPQIGEMIRILLRAYKAILGCLVEVRSALGASLLTQ